METLDTQKDDVVRVPNEMVKRTLLDEFKRFLFLHPNDVLNVFENPTESGVHGVLWAIIQVQKTYSR